MIGNKHRVTREEAMKWFQQKVGAVALETVGLPGSRGANFMSRAILLRVGKNEMYLLH